MDTLIQKRIIVILIFLFVFAKFFNVYAGGGYIIEREDVKGFSGKVFLIAIGIDDYSQTKLYNCRFCKSDATAFVNRIKKDSSFNNVQPFVLNDRKATKQAIRDTISMISKIATPEDLFIFFSASFSIDGALILSDSSTISSIELFGWSQSVLTKRQLYFLDAGFGESFTQHLKKNIINNPELAGLCKQDRVVLSVPGLALEDDQLKGGIFTMSYVRNKNAKIMDAFSSSNRVKTDFLYSLYHGDSLVNRLTSLEIDCFSERDFFQSIAVNKRGRSATLIDEKEQDKKMLKTIRKGETLCLMVGIKDYQNTNTLKNTLNDSRALTDVLSMKYRTTIIPLENPTYIEFMNALTEIKNEYNFEEGSQFLFFAAAHGGMNQLNEGCLLLKDYHVDKGVTFNAIPLTSIKLVVSDLKCTNSLILLDICHSGTILNTEDCVAPAALEMPKTHRLYNDPFNSSSVAYINFLKQKTKIFIGSSNDQEAADGEGDHSPFAKVVLSFLENNKQPVMDTYYLKKEIQENIFKEGAISTPQFCMYGGCKDDGRFLFFLK